MSLRDFARQNGLRPLGQHHVFIDRQGQPVVIREETRRSNFRGEDDFGGGGAFEPTYMGEMGEMGGRMGKIEIFQPSYMAGGGDDFGDEYVGDDDLGRPLFRRRQGGGGHGGHGGHGGGQRRRYVQQQVQAAEEIAMEQTHVNVAGSVPKGWCNTMLAETSTYTGAANAQVQIRLQHAFLAQDLTFAGSVAGAKVVSIAFADRLVWNNPKGVDVSVFATGSFLRNFVNGQRLQAGLDITITGTVPGAGDFTAVLTGSKPYAVPMGQ